MEFQVDCQTFLRITGERLGPAQSDLYVIRSDGVHAWKDGFGTGDLEQRLGGSHSDALFLDFIETARLLFPASANSLIAWQKRNPCFDLPDWLPRVAEATTSSSALEELASCDAEYKVVQDAAARLLARLKTAGVKASEWYPVEAEWNRLLALRAAIESIRMQIATTDSSKVQPKRTGRGGPRIDRLRAQIAHIVKSAGGSVSPADVMSKLLESAGKPGSCVKMAKGDGFIWAADGLTDKFLSMGALRSRLRKRP